MTNHPRKRRDRPEHGRDLVAEWYAAWADIVPPAEAPDAHALFGLLRAGIRGDTGAVAGIVAGYNIYALLCLTLAFASAAGEQSFGSIEAFDAWLAAAQAGDPPPWPGPDHAR
jgi:hypothetical protein